MLSPPTYFSCQLSDSSAHVSGPADQRACVWNFEDRAAGIVNGGSGSVRGAADAKEFAHASFVYTAQARR